ncbi:DUF6215 domain-containing protein [Streptomyces sp. NPDC019396]|uniref:DUF6215 domain-containing protein n=1 Tax=Streptomyces sp. NPDC019396 TaxID=3154687 RepID=UPI0033E85C6F
MAGENGVPGQRPGTKEATANGWGQAIAALVVVGALTGALFLSQQASSADSAPARSPGTCLPERPEEPEKASSRVSGAELCETLNRPDLAALLGTPGESPTKANGSDSAVGKIAIPEGQVEFATYSVNLSATYDGEPVAGSSDFLRNAAQHRTFLGRPAVLYSTQTIKISFNLGGSGGSGGSSGGGGSPSLPARTLTVAQDAKDGGGSFDVTLWRTDGSVPDDATLLRVAETVLPTIPGWDAEGPLR